MGEPASFAEVLAEARARAGGTRALEARLPRPETPEALGGRPDSRYLSLMSLRIFQAGLKHDMVRARWPAFEEAFSRFEPARVAAMSDEGLEALLNNRRLIRHWGKIKAVRKNAATMCALTQREGGFGRWLAAWPGAEIVGLWAEIARHFSQMGGSSAPRFLRLAGKDTFLLTRDTERGLVRFGGLEAAPKGKRGAEEAQAVFNGWAEETGRPLCQLSMILAIAAG